jgi:hypothetical protein
VIAVKVEVRESRRKTMSIVVRFTPASATTTEQYEETIRRLQSSGDWPADGLEYHVAFFVDGQLRVSEIWESQEKLTAFGERLMPILADVGIDPGQPEILEVYKIVKP